MFERPTTTASPPGESPSRLAEQHQQPSGVQGTNRAAPLASRPTLSGWKPSTSFAGAIASITRASSMCVRQRQLDQDAVRRAASRVQRSTSAEQLGLRVAAGRRCSTEYHRRPRGSALSLFRT